MQLRPQPPTFDPFESFAAAAVFDLSHSWFVGMPISPAHPPYTFTLVRHHGDVPRDDGVCTANELVVMCGHTGTHLDALGHASRDGRLAGGLEANLVQRGGKGLKQLGIETVAPIVCRGVLLDVAAAHGVDCLQPAYEVSAADLELAEARSGTRLRRGDAALIRTGWARYWGDTERFAAFRAERVEHWRRDRGRRQTLGVVQAQGTENVGVQELWISS